MTRVISAKRCLFILIIVISIFENVRYIRCIFLFKSRLVEVESETNTTIFFEFLEDLESAKSFAKTLLSVTVISLDGMLNS